MPSGIWPQILTESVSAVTNTASVSLGTVRIEGAERYMYLYNAGNSQINPGYGTILSASTGYSVTLSSVTSTDSCFAVVKHVTATTGAYFWGLKVGYSNVKSNADTGLSDIGGVIVLGDNGVFTRKTGATGYFGRDAGYVCQLTGSGGTAYAYVSLL